MNINFRVEFDPQPIRHVAVQCPHCGRWFKARDITKDNIACETDLEFATFYCPVCEHAFSAYTPSWSSDDLPEVKIEEVGYPEVYKHCLKRREIWE